MICGYTEDEAWTAITHAHPTAFTKSRLKGRLWWWWLWNAAVRDADAWLTSRRRARQQGLQHITENLVGNVAKDGTEDVTDLFDLLSAVEQTSTPDTTSPNPDLCSVVVPPQVATTFALVEATWRSWPARTRHIDRELATTVLVRLARIGSTEAAIPQRDLLQDCAIYDRKTIRSSLARLQESIGLQVLPTYVPGTTDTANTLRLPDQVPSQPGDRTGTLSVIPPSRLHPPSPPGASSGSPARPS